MIYLTADWHLGHAGIIQSCKRPFEDCAQMQFAILDCYKEAVKPNDDVVFVGDIFWDTKLPYMKSVLDSLPGDKHLVKGNHDNATVTKYIKAGFKTVEKVSTVLNWQLNNYHIYHDPAFSQINRKDRYICAHIHDLFLLQKNVINVGVDVWNWYPVPITLIDWYFNNYGLENFV